MCRYEMAELHLEFPNFFHIAGRILSLLCRAFGYELELNHTFQERIEYEIVNIAKIYILTKAEGYKDIPVPLVILVTRDPKIDSGAVAQTLGYFCKGQGKKTSTKQGLAILLNGYNNKVQVKIFTYLYYKDPNEGYGIQSLVLPVYECSYEEFIDGKFLNFLLILCSPATNYLFRIKFEQEKLIKPSQTILVVTDTEFAVNTALREQAIQHEQEL